jgi:DNA-directed RNA polymerase subunit M/transcription elongation factor TFIIS
MGKRDVYVIKVYCRKCGTLLYKYRKEGRGHLIKCYKSNILRDFTNGDLKCPKCGEEFAKEAIIHGRPANKIIQGKVFIKS